MIEQREELINKLNYQLDILAQSLSKFTEKELDSLMLPHPLMDKLTLKEMLFFTIYHVNHHLQKTKENLK